MTTHDYEALNQLVEQAGIVLYPAEVHGLATGLLTVDELTPGAVFVDLVAGQDEEVVDLNQAQRSALIEWFEFTRQQLRSLTMEFMPLLPDDDDEDVDFRLDAACDWARGMVYALSERLPDLQGQSSEVESFVQDLMSLAEGNFDADDDSAEEVYAELVEYLRVGTLMLQEELQPTKAPPRQLLH